MFNVFSNRSALALLLLCTGWLVGCAGTLTQETLPSPADRLIAKDFAQIVSQVERYAPNNTTFLVAKPIGPESPFDLALREEFLIAGYKVEYLSFDSDAADPVMSQVVEQSESADGELRTHTLSVNNVSFRRSYIISKEGQITPETTMQAKGVDSDVLRQDDSIFGIEVDGASSEFGSNPEVSPSDAQPVSDPNDEELIDVQSGDEASVNLSNYSALQGMQIIDESLLVFSGDSLVLGDANKRSVVKVVKNYRSDSDVFSLLGCVRNDDIDWTEQASKLVIGRTERVRSELRYAGIPNEQIKTENCTRERGVDAPRLPSNGVLLLLNRRQT